MRKELTEEEIIEEIERLSNSEYVKLSKLKERQDYKLRQKLYTLRCHEKKGKALAEAGITREILKGIEE